MAYENSLYPEWSWSYSRRMMLEDCPRKYYYHYYASHNGWLENSDKDAKRIYRLKQLKNLYLIFGNSVHHIAEMIIRRWHLTNQMPLDHELIDQLRGFLNQAYKDSLNQTQWWKQPTRKTMLHEIYYNGELPVDTIRQIKNRTQICVDNLLKSASIQEHMNNSYAELIELEKLNSINMDDTKIYVKIDFMYRVGNRYVIVDWKTGREDMRYDDQLMLYAHYVHQNYGVPLEDIEIRTEYLLTGECVKNEATSRHMTKLLSDLRSSISIMRSYLQNMEQNIPFSMENFNGVSSSAKCKACNFRDVCDVKTL